MKRKIIAILLTAAVLIVSHKLYISEIIRICFTVDAPAGTEYQLYFNQKNGQNISKNNSVKGRIGKDGKIDVTVEAPRIQALYLDFTDYSKNVTVKDGFVQGRKIKNLEITPKLIFENINAGCEYEVDIDIFIVIAVISFCFIYKIINWLAVFKIFQHNSRIDLVFLFACFVVLFVPALSIDQSENSMQENRALARYIPLIENGKINFSFGRDFDAWFSDRFYRRRSIVKMYNKIHSRFSRNELANAVIGSDGWLFGKAFNAMDVFRNANLFSPEDIKKINENLEKLNNFAEENNKKVYLFFSPDKETIYGDYYLKSVRKQNDHSRLEQLRMFLDENPFSNITYIYSVDALKKARENGTTVFCRTGTHMNNPGSFIEYQVLSAALKKDYPGITPIQLSDLEITVKPECDRDVLNGAGIADYPEKYMLNDIYRLKQNNARQSAKQIQPRKDMTITYFENPSAGNKLKVLLMGDSFSGQYITYMAETFYKFYHIFTGGGMFFNPYILRYEITKLNPDIIIIESTERFLFRFAEFDITAQE